MVADTQPGAEVSVGLERDGAAKGLSLRIGEMPAEKTASVTPDAKPKDIEPHLGLFLAPLTPEARQAQGLDEDARGVLVAGVERGSAAESAGIRPGSLVTMVGRQSVKDPMEAKRQVNEAIGTGSNSVLLRIEQDGEARFVALKPTA